VLAPILAGSLAGIALPRARRASSRRTSSGSASRGAGGTLHVDEGRGGAVAREGRKPARGRASVTRCEGGSRRGVRRSELVGPDGGFVRPRVTGASRRDRRTRAGARGGCTRPRSSCTDPPRDRAASIRIRSSSWTAFAYVSRRRSQTDAESEWSLGAAAAGSRGVDVDTRDSDAAGTRACARQNVGLARARGAAPAVLFLDSVSRSQRPGQSFHRLRGWPGRGASYGPHVVANGGVGCVLLTDSFGEGAGTHARYRHTSASLSQAASALRTRSRRIVRLVTPACDAPSDADETSAAYLRESRPSVAGLGGRPVARRAASSSSEARPAAPERRRSIDDRVALAERRERAPRGTPRARRGRP
jgi:hypothetical protein